MDQIEPDAGELSHDLGPERQTVQRHLERRFPEVDPITVARVIDQAAEATAGAKIQSFRPLLVEHRASDRLIKLRQAR